MNWQADDWLSTRTMNAVGAVRLYAQRVNFFTSIPNTLMISVIFYQSTEILRAAFPTVVHWVAFYLFVLVPAAIVIDRVLLHPAQISYTSHQNSKRNRNPTHRLVEDIHAATVERTDGGATVAPTCEACGEYGISGMTDDEAPCIRCPECDDVLYEGAISR